MAEDKASWYALSVEEVARRLQVDPEKGLSSSDAQQRLQKVGPNVLAAKKKESELRAFVRQYGDLMQIILLAAAAISLLITRDLGTAMMLASLTVINAVMSLNQEAKAGASLASLQKMLKTVARVRRDGQAIEIDAEELVPGDVVLMEAGNRVPADGRLFVAATLEVEEAALTGESVPTLKDTGAVGEPDASLGDRLCMAFMNTSVTRGRGEMIVTETGMATEMGHIADLLNKTKSDKTPLQKQLDSLTARITAIAGVTLIIMVAIGLARGESFEALFVAGMVLAVSAIPTGMPVIVTTLYSMGTQVLAAQNAIVKRLPSVETLGSVSAICSDKTGTLTLNKMTAREFFIPGQNRYTVTGEGYSTEGKLLHGTGISLDLNPVLLPMALCADARLDGDTLIGDPTEGALIVLAAKGGIDADAARATYPRIAEVPFDSDYKFMATFHHMVNEQGDPVVRCFVKGAPDVLYARSGSYWLPGGGLAPISDESRPIARAEHERMAERGERVMVVARRDLDPATFDARGKLIDLVRDLTILAMVGIVDPPRAEAKDAIAKCKTAGIRVRMITGDNAVTAAAIGRELGIPGRAMTGAEFANANDEELLKQLSDIGVVARVAPQDKIRMVDLLQRQANIVAMTGDGVNDAPALKKADIGVAMGITGTEVSKEAAVMILTDDNFATIVKAIEYGRALYDNLSKYIRFQMALLVGFIACSLGATLLNIAAGAPFTPQVILFINFAIHVPLALALSNSRPSPGLMGRKPRPLSQPVLTRAQWMRIFFLGVAMAAGTLYVRAAYASDGEAVAATMAYAVFSLFSVALALSARDETGTVFNRDVFSERSEVRLYGVAVLLTFFASELNVFQRILGLAPLTARQWLVTIGLAVVLMAADDVIKYFLRRQAGEPAQPARPAQLAAS